MAEFNDEQKRIITWPGGMAVVAASAGSGKTRCLSSRAAWLVTGGPGREPTPAPRVLVLAYNTSAGAELKKRVAKSLNVSPNNLGVAAGTFHSWGRGRLLETLWDTGKQPRTDTQIPLITYSQASAFWRGIIRKQLYTRFDDKTWKANSKEVKIKLWTDLADRAREACVWLQAASKANDLLVIESLPTYEGLLRGTTLKPDKMITPELIWDFIRAYQDYKNQLTWTGNIAKRNQPKKIVTKTGVIDYGDMLWKPAAGIYMKVPQAKAWQRYDHIMIDEAQDSTPVRCFLGDFLAQTAKSYLLVGDLRQSINGWAGARPDLYTAPLSPPDRDHPIGGQGMRELVPGVKVGPAKMLPLVINYRSGSKIIELANLISDGQNWNLGGATIAGRAPVEGKIDLEYISEEDGSVEFYKAVLRKEMERGLADAEGRSRVAFLSRTRAGLLIVRTVAKVMGIPVRAKASSGSIWSSGPARAILGYLKAASQDYSGVESIYFQPNRYINGAEFASLLKKAETEKIDVAQYLAAFGTGKAQLFGEELIELQGLEWLDLCGAVKKLLTRSITERKNEDDSSTEDLSAIDSLEALIYAAEEMGSVGAVDEDIRREKEEMEEQEDATAVLDPRVELSTCHASKGLEWEKVYVINVDKAVFPSARAEDPGEEHRLFYVACTRAKDHLVVTTHNASPYVKDYVKPMLESRVAAGVAVASMQNRAAETGADRITDDEIESEIRASRDERRMLEERIQEPDLPGSVAMLDERWAAAALQAAKDDAKDSGRSLDPSRDHQRKTHALLQLLRPLGFFPAGPGLSSGRLRVWVDDDAEIHIDRDEKHLTSTAGGADVLWRTWTIDNLARAVVEG